ncbi:protein CASP-like [Dermacentor andersoni]|uniref:protein CASP-like n=1 Tax=Dermacentor andersoni TaxID=34620 RepID=UPI0024167D5C|nr:protein CASP-like [Dermacentor andersoni]
MAAGTRSSVRFWSEFDLPRLKKELDVTATELVDRQDASDAARSRLVQLCREFKKTAPHDVRCLVSPLLRHFQAEVDRLGERSLAAEAAFLALYKRLLRAVSAAHSVSTTSPSIPCFDGTWISKAAMAAAACENNIFEQRCGGTRIDDPCAHRGKPGSAVQQKTLAALALFKFLRWRSRRSTLCAAFG